MYNIPRFNSKGKPICEICEVAFDRLLLHVNRRHDLKAYEYKAKFNYHPRKGIQSTSLHNKMSKNAKKNYKSVIMNNLIIGGQKTRFKEGNDFTNIELVRKISKARMTAYWDSKKQTKENLVLSLIRKLESS